MVHSVLLARVSASDAADLVQDVFLAALKRIRNLRRPEAIGAWLVRLARNRAADHHRRARAARPLPADLTAGDDRAVEAREALEAIRGLPDAYRETLLMRLVEGMTGPEIAAATGRTHGSVRVNLSRGMKLLKERMGEP
jgi:RNA polymerase sigma-70 factor (ECF subfamily)